MNLKIKSKIKNYKNSLKINVLLTFFLSCIPVLVLLFATNYHSINLIQNKIYENNLETLRLNMSLLDVELEKTSDWLMTERFNNKNWNAFASTDDETRYKASISFMQLLNDNLPMFDYIEGVMVYSGTNDNQVYRFSEYSDEFLEREIFMDYVKEHISELSQNPGQWSICEINGKNVLICVIGNERNMICAWTTIRTLEIPIRNWKLGDGAQCVFVSDAGRLLSDDIDIEESLAYINESDNFYYAGEEEKYLITGVSSSYSDIRMIVMVDREELVGIFYLIRRIVLVIIAIYFLLGVPVIIKSLNKRIFHPMHRLERGITEIEAGNFDVKIENKHSSTEMGHLINSFNDMTSQVKDLKIQVYEEALEVQKLEMDYMQLQLEPHFYLNALNLINMMAQMNDVDMIQELTENLSEFLRYIVGSGKGEVTLQDELDHLNHYLKIMRIRFGDTYEFISEIAPEVLDIKVPPLIIQLLVENSMKYAFDIERNTVIHLSVKKENHEIVISVQDSGVGYNEKILKQFRENIPPEDNHIGLWNLKQRLDFMYREKSSFEIYNVKPQGARTDIRIVAEE